MNCKSRTETHGENATEGGEAKALYGAKIAFRKGASIAAGTWRRALCACAGGLSPGDHRNSVGMIGQRWTSRRPPNDFRQTGGFTEILSEAFIPAENGNQTP
jgi:hypothetical protein